MSDRSAESDGDDAGFGSVGDDTGHGFDSGPEADEPLLRVENLTTRFRTDAGTRIAVDGVSFDVERGETVCLVGESGSGKTVASESVTRLIAEPPGEIAGGSVRFEGRDLLSLPDRELRAVRGGRIAHVFQNPQSALNPVYTIGWQLIEAVRLHADVSKDEARARAVDLLNRVGIPDPAGRIDDYPHELSGGQRQRVAIAMALAGEPDLLIADEPTTALDVTIQSQVLRLFADLQSELGMGVLLVTHDLGVVAEVADRVVVLYGGRVMERGDVFDVFERPSHPYTRSLLDSIPGRGSDGREASPHRPPSTDASVPDSTESAAGCRFRERCPHAVEACGRGGQPPLFDVPAAADHVVSCVHFGPDGDPAAVYGSDGDADGTCDDADGDETCGDAKETRGDSDTEAARAADRGRDR